MKRTTIQSLLRTHPGILVVGAFLLFAVMLTGFANAVRAQGNQLSLADILIALRSKKVTLPERNKILSDAIQSRGTTFSMTPEIEKELSGGGADKSLLDSIRQKPQIAMRAAVIPVSTEPRPKSEPSTPPAAPDFSFYEKRAEASSAKGDFDAAVIDFTKAIEMNAGAVTALLGRASAYFNKNLFTLAIADYSKAIELSPQNASAYARRGAVYEKKGNEDLAAADYKKALEIDPANESAKTLAARLEADMQAKAKAKVIEKVEPAPAPAKTATAAVPPPIPEFLNLGLLSESQAIRMVKPIYPQTAFKSNIGGKVVVEVELGKDGSVTSAKVVEGHPFLRQNSEDAARKCKFKPPMFGDQAVKAKGTIVYNFVLQR